MYTVAAFYRFTPLADPHALRDAAQNLFAESGLCGTTLFAPEGINGTMAGTSAEIESYLSFLAEHTGLVHADIKFSTAEERPFGRLKLRVKKEIIAFRKAEVDPSQAGNYVDASEWNRLIADPEVLVLDTRNDYEVKVGTFERAVDPEISTFSDFATWVRDHLDPAKHRKVAMFCTGGIRCEKASAFMLQEGFQEVHHLRGGILKYLEDVPASESLWRGECFVFDERVSLGHDDLQPPSTVSTVKRP